MLIMASFDRKKPIPERGKRVPSERIQICHNQPSNAALSAESRTPVSSTDPLGSQSRG
jgi:hypothetical protein